ncbi:MAG: hypothetical protein JST82_07065 [Bacteroidetes bacterium]|nr:hypothetical protein [Bacteroidota bacterium]
MQVHTIANRWIEGITSQKNWIWVSALLLTALAFFFAFPSYGSLDATEWQPLFDKADHLFANSNYHEGTHAAKLTFRMVLPAIVHFLHLSITGVLILLGIAGILNFYLVVRIANNILHDKREAFIIGLCTAFIYTGRCSFTELRGTMFDGLAMFFLLCALNTRINLLLSLFIFFAAWTDERALVASLLLWVFYVVKNDHKRMGLRLFTSQALWIYVAWIAYAACRYFLSYYYGMYPDNKGVGLSVLLNQINNIPLGVWSALEGLWILVLWSMILLYRDKRYFELLKYVGVCALILVIGLSVVDITRSVMYIFPAVFVALLTIHKYADKTTFNRLLWIALILCFVYPAYYTGGKSSNWWTYPLPLQMLR